MQIGIVSMPGENYGTVLQSFALEKAMFQIGSCPHHIEFAKSSPMRALASSVTHARTPEAVAGALAKARSQLRHRVKIERLRAFVRAHLDVRVYEGEEDLRIGEASTGTFICGSDQIWNPKFNNSRLFYLQFASDTQPCFSYAASIAVPSLTDEEAAFLREKLMGFECVSVRERGSVELLQKRCGLHNVRWDCDPVFLFDKCFWWRYASGRFSDDRYLFVYMLRPEADLIRYAKAVGSAMGLRVMYIGDHIVSDPSIKHITDAGIEDFIDAIGNAEYVVTNSFHATAFSIIFEKQFVSHAISGTGTRVSDLLHDVGLDDRELDLSRAVHNMIEEESFSHTRDVVGTERAHSLTYLRKICGGDLKKCI